MDFSLTDEQALLADMIGRLFEHEHDSQTRRKLVADVNYIPATVWPKMAAMGLLGLYIPEALGGTASPAQDSAAMVQLVAKAIGRHLVVEPFVCTAVVAASLIAEAGSAHLQESYLPGVADGSIRIAVATQPWTDDEAVAIPQAEPLPEGGYRLNGQTTAIDTANVQWLVVPARVPGETGLALCLIPSDARGLVSHRSRTLDGTELLCIELRDVAVTGNHVIARPEHGSGAWQRALHRGIAALTAEAVGAMEKLLEMSIEYVKMRRQFGKPLSEFQALRHHVADMGTAVEQAASMSLAAAAALSGSDTGTAAQVVSAAKHLVGRLSRQVAEQAVQLHGGIGMTEELPVGHYFRRLIVIDSIWGNADQHLDRYSRRTA